MSLLRQTKPLLLYIAIFAVIVPWYWPRDDDSIWFGFPAWTFFALAGSVTLSCVIAWHLRRPWPGEEEAEAPAGPGREGER